MIGWFYPGTRAASARNEYPDTIFASFATSAPVQALINMSVYHEQIYRSMVANGICNCASDIHAALEYIDNQLSHEEFYQSNNEEIHSLLSRYRTLECQQVMCNRQFPKAVKSGKLPPQPKAEALNAEFGDWNIRAIKCCTSVQEDLTPRGR
ncbi:hypothetical protein BDW66DRAFT_136038 [Aspergillus desertorum]